VEAKQRTLSFYRTKENTEPCHDWLSGLRDKEGRATIRTRLNRVQNGNLSNCKSVGDGVHELKIDLGPGYRVYFGTDGDSIILLYGGDKDTQVRDIVKAKQYWSDYNA
jgi:putative addiction module killer protein